MKYLNKTQFERIKMSLTLAEIGEVIRTSGHSHDTVKWVDASESYEEYLSIYQEKEAAKERAFSEESIKASNGYVWIRPKTITDLWSAIEELKQMMQEIKLSQ